MKSIMAMVSLCLAIGIGTVRAGDCYEPNNSRAAARNISAGSTQTHTIDPAGDVDWIRFAPPTLGRYHITVYADGLPVLGEIWIQQGLLPEIPWMKINLAKGKSATAVYTASKGAGCIKLGIWGASRSSTGSYRVQVVKK